jgi:hypothetical protein
MFIIIFKIRKELCFARIVCVCVSLYHHHQKKNKEKQKKLQHLLLPLP